MLRISGSVLAALVFASAASAELRGRGTIEFVDGTTTECEVLFEHPNCERLVVRSLGNRTLQSFALAAVRKVTVGDRSKEYSAARKLTRSEVERLEVERLWGDEASAKRIGRYADQDWPERPAIIWAHPGKSGNAMQPGSWLDETGQPLSRSPWKKLPKEGFRARSSRFSPPGMFDGDILLPAAKTQYRADQPGHRDHLGTHTIRHLTVEGNASYSVRYTIEGNLWLKDMGDLGDGTQTGGFGNADRQWHTFARFCGRRWPEKRHSKEGESRRIPISHWVYIHTGGSLEIIGETGGPGDRLTLRAGTLIVSENSHVGNGPRGSFYTEPGTTAVLLDGASCGCLDKVLRGRGGTYGIGGTLMFGTPDHPLTRDLRFEAALFNAEDIDPAAKPAARTRGASIVLAKTGRIVTHSADPKTVRVVFCPRPADAPYSGYAVGERAGGREMPKGIAAVFAGETEFDGVVFEGFHKGGIVVDPKARTAWRNVSFGENLAPPEALFRDLSE